MRQQGRAVATWELWAFARGTDVRGRTADSREEAEAAVQVSLGKVFGSYANPCSVGPDPFYKMQMLKDESKANKNGRNELIGAPPSPLLPAPRPIGVCRCQGSPIEV